MDQNCSYIHEHCTGLYLQILYVSKACLCSPGHHITIIFIFKQMTISPMSNCFALFLLFKQSFQKHLLNHMHQEFSAREYPRIREFHPLLNPLQSKAFVAKV